MFVKERQDRHGDGGGGGAEAVPWGRLDSAARGDIKVRSVTGASVDRKDYFDPLTLQWIEEKKGSTDTSVDRSVSGTRLRRPSIPPPNLRDSTLIHPASILRDPSLPLRWPYGDPTLTSVSVRTDMRSSRVVPLMACLLAVAATTAGM